MNFHFEPTGQRDRASLAVDLTVRSPHRVSLLLYGKFREHLGLNICQGMDAQILYNPTFGPLELDDARIRRLGKRLGWPEAEILALRGESLSDENTLREPRRITPQPSTLPVNDGPINLTLVPYSLTRLTVARQ